MRVLVVVALLWGVAAGDEVIICEDVQDTITCPRGCKVDIISATYGRTSPTLCEHEKMSNTSCDSTADITGILQNHCASQAGTSSCIVTPTNAFFDDDPCEGTYKYLTVNYNCEETCVCTHSGDPHTRTFYDRWIHFQGTCTYSLMAASHDNDTCNMAVDGKFRQRNPNKPVSYLERIYITIGSDQIIFDQGKEVKVNGFSWVAPYTTDDYEISLIGRYVVVENNCGMVAMFDGNHRVKIMINMEDGDTIDGMCGKCTDPEDIYRTRDGTDVSNEPDKYNLIGMSYWQPQYNEDEAVCQTPEDPPSNCTTEEYALIASNDYCGLILDENGPFQECLALPNVDASDFFFNCEYDVCANLDDPAEQICNALEDFMRHCYEIGSGPISFRNETFCPYTCGANAIHNNYITEIGNPPSCVDPNPPPPVPSDVPYEMCVCVAGYVLENIEGDCIPEEDCGCTTEDGNYYSVEASFTLADCVTMYTCERNASGAYLVETTLAGCNQYEQCLLVDGDHTCVCDAEHIMIDGVCQPKCICTGHGDTHFNIYDGGKIGYQGVCTYQITYIPGNCPMFVHVNNRRFARRPGYTVIQNVIVEIATDNIILDQHHAVKVNNEIVATPILETDYTIIRHGKYTVLTNLCGTKVLFDGKRTVKIVTGRTAAANASGICGNCDGDSTNDNILSDGTDVTSDPHKDILIGNSWWTPKPGETEATCLIPVEE